MSDHIARDREEHSDERRSEAREKQDHCQEREEFQKYARNCWNEEGVERNITKEEYSQEYRCLESEHEENNESKSEKLPEKDRWPSYRLREHEKYRPPLDLASNHPTTEKEYHRESCKFDKRKSEIIEYSLESSERESLERERNEDKNHSKKKNQGEEFIADKFADSILCYSEHGFF